MDFWLIAASCGSALSALLLVTWGLLKANAQADDERVVAVGRDAARSLPDVQPLVMDQDGNVLIGVRRGPQ
jgi:hypothetical protein